MVAGGRIAANQLIALRRVFPRLLKHWLPQHSTGSTS